MNSYHTLFAFFMDFILANLYRLPRNSKLWLLVSTAFAYTINNSAYAMDLQSAQPSTVIVTTTGQHPSGGSFDGLRLYFLPFETTSVTPPDIRLMLVRETGWEWVGEPAQGLSPCPDANACRFSSIPLPDNSPFALVVMDGDPWMRTFVESTDGVTTTFSSIASEAELVFTDFTDNNVLLADLKAGGRQLLETIPTWGVTESIASTVNKMPTLKRLGQQALDSVSNLANSPEMVMGFVPGENDFIDAVILTPLDGVSPERLLNLTTLVRQAVAEEAGTVIGSTERRISGQITIQSAEECALIPCELAFSSIFILEE